MIRLALLALTLLAAFSGAGLMLGGQWLGETAPAAQASVAAAPAAVPASGPRLVALKADARGHFQTDMQFNGKFTRALIDTGASVIAMSAEDAAAAGIRPPPGAYTIPMQTANGLVRAAKVRIEEVRLQSIVLRDVEAAVLPAGAFRGTLLGMSFLKRLQGFEMNGGTLLLRQ